MTDILQNHYSQVKNPNPVFTPREGKKTLPFCRKLMAKAEGFTSRFDFSIHVAFLRSLGKRHRMPPLLRRRAIDALLQAMCFHYDPLANRVQRSITNMAIECGLATESRSGNLSVSRATRALKFLAELGLITYQTEYDPQIGCNIPTDITFTPALFSALDVSEVAVVAARRSRVEWENLQRKKQKLKPLEMDELIAKAWRFVRERFRSYQAERKFHGRKRDTARRDASRQRHDIETRVRQQLTREYATGRFMGDKEALKREVERRVQERMLLSRGNNYTRLATVPL
ncbi:incFII family plasmid replication initiator RepA [Klebsiella quasipneumoniae]|uniref:incFII family plasmid replication initiator RepA n=1 Tax=Klebsiella quasipneumoniae TaxID=1463165 RepID=UPI000DE6E9E2|nr:incFII family plasmid replication initiator RepA [Klebsiella quasipneumoniae]MVX81606.1 incFII family plasmid replication initiator RepA [Enterobacteriaceae bacterium 8376wD9]MVY24173.1 incFII family plasmid replication initiator RepA [Enterobacteriaceae bacterium 8376wB8]HBR1895682.1 incFII family plasmid replication initiator RepA [Klebsiella quasipneumoniae subsp. similipneumoniae]MCL1510549.1 incFII family plasmid replication initiator RepA [Klebsiella quasipneumoniae]USP87845.1 incFII 